MPSQCASATATIPNRLGLHARPATLFVETASEFDSTVTVRREGDEAVDGKSIMQIMMLGATQGTTLEVMAEGPDSEAAVAALKELIESGFRED